MSKTRFAVRNKSIVVSLMLLALLMYGCQYYGVSLENNLTSEEVEGAIQLNLSVVQIQVLDEIVISKVILKVESESNSSNVSGNITLPKGFEVIEGSLNWKTDLQENKPEKIEVTIKSDKEATGVIVASSAGASSSVEVNLQTMVEPAGYINISDKEFYRGRNRSYLVGLPGGGFVASKPRIGENFTNYFKSLNYSEEYVYFLVQFDVPGGDPTREQIKTLAADNITLFEYHGDHTYYAKGPRTILETKTYDFVRWAGIVEESLMKMPRGIFRYVYRNCTGPVQIQIDFYENLNEEQLSELENVSNGFSSGSGIIWVDASKIFYLLSKDFVKTINWYTKPVLTSISNENLTVQNIFSNITCSTPFKIKLYFENNITSNVDGELSKISESVVFNDSQNYRCVLVKPNIFLEKFQLTISPDGFVLADDPKSLFPHGFKKYEELKNVTC